MEWIDLLSKIKLVVINYMFYPKESRTLLREILGVVFRYWGKCEAYENCWYVDRRNSNGKLRVLDGRNGCH